MLRLLIGTVSAVSLLVCGVVPVLTPPDSRGERAALYALFFFALGTLAGLIAGSYVPALRTKTSPEWLGSAFLGVAVAVTGTGLLATVAASLPDRQPAGSAEPTLAGPSASPTWPSTEAPIWRSSPSRSAAEGTLYSCPYGRVCLYPDEDYQSSQPQYVWFRYETYNFDGVVHRHRLFNNQWDGAYVIAYEQADGRGACFGFPAPGMTNWDWTRINSVRLSKTLPPQCRRERDVQMPN